MIMKERRIDMLGVCEAHMPGRKTKLLLENHQLCYKGCREVRHGVVFTVNGELSGKISHLSTKATGLSVSLWK